MTATTKTPSQAARGGKPAEFAGDGGRTGQGVGGETAYARMLSAPGPRASPKNSWPANGQGGDSMWPVALLVLAMIGTAVVASSTYLTESAALQPKTAGLAAGAATPTDRADARTTEADLRAEIAAADERTEVRLPGPGGSFGGVRSSLLGHE